MSEGGAQASTSDEHDAAVAVVHPFFQGTGQGAFVSFLQGGGGIFNAAKPYRETPAHAVVSTWSSHLQERFLLSYRLKQEGSILLMAQHYASGVPVVERPLYKTNMVERKPVRAAESTQRCPVPALCLDRHFTS